MHCSRRDLVRMAATGIAVVATHGTAAFGETSPAIMDLDFVAPELRSAARELVQLDHSLPPVSQANLATFRKMSASLARPALAYPTVQKRLVPGRGKKASVVVYVVNSDPARNRPAVLHMHGGGFVVGSAIGGIADAQETAAALDCVVVSVDYRLAPETTFAGSIEDNYAALLWLHRNAKSLGTDPDRIAVMGDSAGGGHAALLALTARDRNEVPLVAQILIYPMLDDRTGSAVHPTKNIGKIFWTEERNRFGWRAFLGVEPGSQQVPPKGVPARYADLSGLPPTFIGVGSIDLFVDEDVAYAQRLIDAGVPTTLSVVPGAFHGFDSHAPATDLAKAFVVARNTALRRAFSKER